MLNNEIVNRWELLHQTGNCLIINEDTQMSKAALKFPVQLGCYAGKNS
jgi:hypothetical protein